MGDVQQHVKTSIIQGWLPHNIHPPIKHPPKNQTNQPKTLDTFSRPGLRPGETDSTPWEEPSNPKPPSTLKNPPIPPTGGVTEQTPTHRLYHNCTDDQPTAPHLQATPQPQSDTDPPPKQQIVSVSPHQLFEGQMG